MEDGDKVYSTCEEVFNDESPDYDVGDHYCSGIVKKLKPSEIMYESIVDILLEHMEEALYDRKALMRNMKMLSKLRALGLESKY